MVCIKECLSRPRGQERNTLMHDICIRRATEQDMEALLALYVELHEFHARGLPHWLRIPAVYDHTAARETLKGLFTKETEVIFVAEVLGKMAGLVEVYLKEDEEHPLAVAHRYGYVQSLVVAAAFRKHGLGKALLEEAHRWTQGHGGEEVRLAVWEFSEGPLHFYEALGYSTYKRWLVKAL